MSGADQFVLASAGESNLAPMPDGATLVTGEHDRRRRSDGRPTDDGMARLEKELVMLRKRCRARELALVSMAGAVSTLRRANRALNEENALLRQQISEQGETSVPRIDGPSSRTVGNRGTR